MDSNSLENIIRNLPDKPGCYQFLDKNDTIIYVGKAKNLKNRVSSYFNKGITNTKTRVLVSKIADIRYIVVNNELETLLLENNLIKEYQPRYNILLKDDKTYPSIAVKNEYFPRVFSTRKIVKDGTKYFGPYANVHAMKIVIETIHKLFKLRTCKLILTPEKIAEEKYKVCLQYHIKRCAGPCVGLQSVDEYNKDIEAVSEILKGNSKEVSKSIFDEMIRLSEQQKYEEANILKEKYQALEDFISKSTVDKNIEYNLDVFSYDEDEKSAYINFLNVYKGSVIQAYTFEYRKKLEESKEELLSMGIVEMRTRYGSKNKEIVVPFYPDIHELMTEDEIEFTIPQRGGKRELLLLSTKNVKQYKFDKLKRAETLNPEQRQTRILKEVQNNLHLKELPVHIECFDNSNLQGTNAVSACVVFKMGKPSKKDYRIFNVKTVEGPDDYSTMKEVIYRRYKRLLEENQTLPQLIVVDGGKGQLSSVCEVLKEMGIYGKLGIIGIAERLEELYFPDDPVPVFLDKNSETLKLIQYLRDEAHRFGITRHRKKRSKAQTRSELDNIKGIGKETKASLLSKFKSVKRISESNLEELSVVVGNHKAKLIKEYFENKDKDENSNSEN